MARPGAGVVICPGTEANLGDGLIDLPGWLRTDTPLSLGSDSQVTHDWPQELRWLEYGQRLSLRQRNVGAHIVELHRDKRSLADGILEGQDHGKPIGADKLGRCCARRDWLGALQVAAPVGGTPDRFHRQSNSRCRPLSK